jgi:hypothetical protein
MAEVGILMGINYRAMPLQYLRDDARRRIRVTVTEPFDLDELIVAVEQQLADGAWRYGLLVDARGPLTVSPTSDIQSYATHVRELVAAHGPRGPIAVISRDASMIGGVNKYTLLVGKNETLEVFWDLDDGQRWLDQRLSLTRETPESD